MEKQQMSVFCNKLPCLFNQGSETNKFYINIASLVQFVQYTRDNVFFIVLSNDLYQEDNISYNNQARKNIYFRENILLSILFKDISMEEIICI